MIFAVFGGVSTSRAFLLTNVTWPGGSVPLELQLQAGGPVRSLNWNQTAQACLDEWNRYLHGTRLAGRTNSTAPKAVENGRNNVMWATRVYDEAIEPYVGAFVLVWEKAGDPGTAGEADVIFNPALAVGWDIYTGPLRADYTLDFRRVALTEFGGLLGLDVPNNGDSLMVSEGIGDVEHPQADDLAGIEYLYGPQTAPQIIANPRSFTLGSDGSTAHNFSAEVRGRGPMSYRWRRNGVDQLEGADFVRPDHPQASSPDEQEPGRYTVVVANRYGTTESKAATLKVTQGFTVQPGIKAVTQGATATFSVKYVGPGPYTYTWENQAGPIAGATGPTLTLRNVQPGDAGFYKAVAWDARKQFVDQVYGSLHVKLGATISPANQGVDLGAKVVLTATPLGEPRFKAPNGIIIDSTGTVCVGDGGLREISSAGVVSTRSDAISGQCLALGPKGYIYSGDRNGQRIVRWLRKGAVTLQAGQLSLGTDDGPTPSATFSRIGALAVAPDGTVYAADFDDQVIRRISPRGYVSTLAGKAGNKVRADGKGDKAGFEELAGLALSPAGTLYAIDRSRGYSVIRKITKDGTVSTFAGGRPDYPGGWNQTDGKGTAAGFVSATAIACDAHGNVYVADYTTIRKITPAAQVTTLAGDRLANPGYADGAGKAARFSAAKLGLTVSKAGNVYLTEWDTGVVRKITPSGVVTTYAGKAGETASIDGGPVKYQWFFKGKAIAGATKASLTIAKVAAANAGDYTVKVTSVLGSAMSQAAHLEIKPHIDLAPKVTPVIAGGALTLTVKASSPTGHPLRYQWWKGNQTIAGATGSALTFAHLGTAEVGDYHVVISDGTYETESKPVSVGPSLAFATVPVGGTYRDGSAVFLDAAAYSAYAPGFSAPVAFARDADGDFLIADNGAGVVARLSRAGEVSLLAGSGGSVTSAAAGDGTGAAATFFGFRAMAWNAHAGAAVMADGQAIRLFNPTTSTVTTLAGDASARGSVNGQGLKARFANPAAVAADSAGNIYVADAINQVIRRVSAAGSVSTYAGALGKSGYANGSTAQARFATPVALAVDKTGILFVGDANHVIRKISANRSVATLAGSPGVIGHGDGKGGAATFGWIKQLVIDANGNLFVLDSDPATIRRITPDGSVTTVLQGVDTWIGGLCVTPAGDLAILWGDHIDVWHVAADGALTPSTDDGPYYFDAGFFRAGTLITYQWLHDGVEIPGAHSPTLQVTPDLQAGQEGNYTVRITNPHGTLTSDAVVGRTATAAWGFTVNPATRALAPGDALMLSANAVGTEPLTWQWLKDGVPVPGATDRVLSVGSVTAADRGYYTLSATNAVGTTIGPAVAVNVGRSGDGLPIITRQPSGQWLGSGHEAGFSAQATGGTLTYQWARDGVAIAGATSASFKIAHALVSDAGSYTVRVTNARGAVISSVALLRVDPAELPTVDLDDHDVRVEAGGKLQMRASSWTPTNSLVTYQWKKDGVAIKGATEALLAIDPARIADAGSYTVVATTDAGSVESDPATVRVDPAAPRLTPPMIRPFQEDHAAGPFSFTVSDFDTPESQLIVTARSLNPVVIPTSGIKLGGNGSKRTITLTPARNGFGSAEIVLAVSDGTRETSESLIIEVTNVNDAPTITAIPDMAVATGATSTDVAFIIDDIDTAIPYLTVTAASSNPTLVPVSGIWLRGYGKSHSITITPAAGKTGTAKITLTVSDGQANASTRFTVKVAASSVRKSDGTVAATRSPSIAAQPRSQTVKAGSPATFQVRASSAYRYQWTHDGAAIPGAVSAALVLPSVQLTDAGAYAVSIATPEGSIASHTAELIVVAARSVTERRGTAMIVHQTLSVAGGIDRIVQSRLLPGGWAYLGGHAAGATAAPGPGDRDLLEWIWSAPGKAGAWSFDYVLSFPPDAKWPQTLDTLIEVDGPNGTTRLLFDEPGK